jgi:hypothetical protein
MREFLSQLWATLGQVLWLDPEQVRQAALGASAVVIVAIVVLAGASLLAGQSVALFVARLTPGRFALSLVLNGLLYLAGLMLWACAIWLCAGVVFDVWQPLGLAVRVVGLSAAPLILGFLAFMPYFGEAILWGLRVWSALIALVAVEAVFGLTSFQALICVVLGWLLIMALNVVAGRPLAALRNRLWRAVAGTSFDTDTQRSVAEVTDAFHAQLAAEAGAQEGTDRPGVARER